MNDLLKDRILRRLETLSEERQYQVLDYIEFIESKYAERQAPGPNVFQRFSEGIEDTLRAGNVSAQTVATAMGFMSQAMNVLSDVATKGRSVADGIVDTAKGAAKAASAAASAAVNAEPRPGDASKEPPKPPPAGPFGS